MRVFDHLLKAVCDVVISSSEVQVAPTCVLWPDRTDDVKSVPWHRVFSGDRINDHHPPLLDIHAAREVGRSSS